MTSVILLTTIVILCITVLAYKTRPWVTWITPDEGPPRDSRPVWWSIHVDTHPLPDLQDAEADMIRLTFLEPFLLQAARFNGYEEKATRAAYRELWTVVRLYPAAFWLSLRGMTWEQQRNEVYGYESTSPFAIRDPHKMFPRRSEE